MQAGKGDDFKDERKAAASKLLLTFARAPFVEI